MSMEADLAFFDDDNRAKADAVTAVLDEMTPFHEKYGIYAEGVHLSTATLPDGWQERIIRTHMDGAGTARPVFVEPHDLAASKLAAYRVKDQEFCAALLDAGVISADELLSRVRTLPSNSESAVSWTESYIRNKSLNAVTEKVVEVKSSSGRRFVVKFSYRKHHPYSLSELRLPPPDQPENLWEPPVLCSSTRGKYILDLVQKTPLSERRITRETARIYAGRTGRCLQCGKSLTDSTSLRRGYGPKCASKVR